MGVPPSHPGSLRRAAPAVGAGGTMARGGGMVPCEVWVLGGLWGRGVEGLGSFWDLWGWEGGCWWLPRCPVRGR